MVYRLPINNLPSFVDQIMKRKNIETMVKSCEAINLKSNSLVWKSNGVMRKTF